MWKSCRYKYRYDIYRYRYQINSYGYIGSTYVCMCICELTPPTPSAMISGNDKFYTFSVSILSC